jgi:nucleotide-binding universal stress UspA family protein
MAVTGGARSVGRVRQEVSEMFAKVVVGVRDASHAQDAVALARVLAPGAQLHLVHAYPLALGTWSGAEPWHDGLRADAEELLGGIARDAHIDTPGRVLPDLSPARALQLVAEELQADLMVVGSAHRGPVGRLLAGSVGRSVLAGAPCPVAVAPKGDKERGLGTVGAAYDGSPASQAALRDAAAIARAAEARLRVIRVVPVPREVVTPMYPFTYANYDWERQGELEADQARSAVERAAAGVAEGTEAEGEVFFGHARDELTSLTMFLDLLVTGSRGWGPARRVLLGGTSDHLVHHAACPVLVVPRPASASDAASRSTAAATGDDSPAPAEKSAPSMA